MYEKGKPHEVRMNKVHYNAKRIGIYWKGYQTLDSKSKDNKIKHNKGFLLGFNLAVAKVWIDICKNPLIIKLS
jgi:hypothetical protein